MAAKEIERKIAVILATDVVGYSKHMETDEEQTLRTL
ncbi:MAG: adenylate/guanylate cyclase domain-containing protein, partial [SAR324 cluster bacterium]|nr:adenylate/guanylate cyclase domain-containing protein [SAR324 cluster bacterium]